MSRANRRSGEPLRSSKINWTYLPSLLVAMLLMGATGIFTRAALPSEALSLESAIEAALSRDNPTLPSSEAVDLTALRAFYAQRSYAPIWSGSRVALARGTLLFQTLTESNQDGLSPQKYHVTELARLWPADGEDAVLHKEIFLTDGFFRYAKDVHIGQIPHSEADRDIHLPPRHFDAPEFLKDTLANDRFAAALRTLSPSNPDYLRLREMLAKYRSLAAAGGWEPLTEPINLEEATDAALERLRHRLAAEDATIAENELLPSKQTLRAWLERYQARNGLEPDGLIGPRTLAMLNVSAEERVRQIAANMERWRWLPEFEDRYVTVNVPDATLIAVDGDEVALRSRVIVGAAITRTPILRADSTAITVNPPWNVPHSIAVNEMLPRLKRDPGYLQQQGIVLLNGPEGDPHGLQIDWRAIQRADFSYQLRQESGDNAALGYLKVEMPSPYSVYLHDTPSRNLFTRPGRTLSHGCIRVEQIRPLASWLLTGDADAALVRLEGEIGTGETSSIPLPNPVPIYVLYWTAGANEDGTMGFRPDVYERDRRLIAALGLQ